MRGYKTIPLIEILEGVDDPRANRVLKYPLVEILFTLICGVLCGMQSYKDIETWAKNNLYFLQWYLPFENGTPTAYVLRDVLKRIEPGKVHKLFCEWMRGVLIEQGYVGAAEVIAIDGKQARRTKDTTNGKKPLHVITAIATDCNLILGQLACGQKSNEITKIPELIDLIDIQGAMVTIDAIGTNHTIAEKIREKGGDYLLCVKKNQEKLLKELYAHFTPYRDHHCVPPKGYYDKTEDADHGRTEIRECWLSDNIHALLETNKFEDAACVAMIKRIETRNGKTSEEIQYFICSRNNLTASEFLQYRRSHWAIEATHWVLDMTFREDESRARAGHSAENFNILREIAINILRMLPETSRDESMRQKIIQCGANKEYLSNAIEKYLLYPAM